MSLTDDFRKSITAKDLGKVDIEKLDKFNFDLLGEMSECLHHGENLVDTLNRMKFIIDTKKDIDISLITANFCFLVITEILEKMNNIKPDDLYNTCSLTQALFKYHKVLEQVAND
jgi:hypothetical protein